LSDDKKRKIKIFVKDYMDKVIARKAQKAAKQPEELPQESGGGENGGVPGTSESVSTATPLVEGSTPRDGMGNVEPETPMSGSAEKTPGEGVVEGREDGVFVSPMGSRD
jgi:hypothetical protein